MWRTGDYATSSPRKRRGKLGSGENASSQSPSQTNSVKHPTFGHRFVHQELLDAGIQVGRHKVRQIMKALGLLLQRVKKLRRVAPAVTPEAAYPPPPGRRVQIDATHVQLDTSKVWVYIVQDVCSRACLAIRAVDRLSQYSAREVLLEAIARLHQLGKVPCDPGNPFRGNVGTSHPCGAGVDNPIVIQSDTR